MSQNEQSTQKPNEQRHQTTLEEFSEAQFRAVEEVLHEMATDLASVEDIAHGFGLTETRAENILENMIQYDDSCVAVTPVGKGIYLIEEEE